MKQAALADDLFCRVLVLWGGLAIGVAFLATPAKFLAPSLSLPVALDVGRHTFAIYNHLEIAILAILLIAAVVMRPSWLKALAVPGIVVIGQALWLIPALDSRVTLILAGRQPPASSLHLVYIAAEAVKIGALLLFGFVGVKDPRRVAPLLRTPMGARGWRGRP